MTRELLPDGRFDGTREVRELNLPAALVTPAWTSESESQSQSQDVETRTSSASTLDLYGMDCDEPTTISDPAEPRNEALPGHMFGDSFADGSASLPSLRDRDSQ
jgi:hypothetical protein